MTGIIAQNVGRTSGLIKAASGGGGEVWTLIKTLTSDGSDADLTFIDGSDDVTLDSTYPIYKFVFINIHPETDETYFGFNFTIDGTNWNVTKTSTAFFADHTESDGGTPNFTYWASQDLAQGTGFQNIGFALGTDNDQSSSGELTIYSPSSTTFVKHFMAVSNSIHASDLTVNGFIAGYGNTTSAVTGVQFKMSADEIQGGKIKLYGLKDSA
jgi:hypothetical protein